jgi:hypothetical protein
LNYFENDVITFMVYAIQKDIIANSNILSMSTRVRFIMNEKLEENLNLKKKNKKKELKLFREQEEHELNMDSSQLKVELRLLQRKHKDLADREELLKKLCIEWSKKTNNKEVHSLLNDINKIMNKKLKN